MSIKVKTTFENLTLKMGIQKIVSFVKVQNSNRKIAKISLIILELSISFLNEYYT